MWLTSISLCIILQKNENNSFYLQCNNCSFLADHQYLKSLTHQLRFRPIPIFLFVCLKVAKHSNKVSLVGKSGVTHACNLLKWRKLGPIYLCLLLFIDKNVISMMSVWILPLLSFRTAFNCRHRKCCVTHLGSKKYQIKRLWRAPQEYFQSYRVRFRPGL